MANDRKHVRLPDGTHEDIDRIAVSKNITGTDAIIRSVEFYTNHLVELGEIPPRHREKRDLGLEAVEEFKKMIFGNGGEDVPAGTNQKQ
ncbi:hypothetical protein [Methanolobus sp. WCC4]|uniref:hypothetical protein n=1 Tax=Methanolobus sp. WCC4 TaxID=3125784 RepID=UPI0030F4C57E